MGGVGYLHLTISVGRPGEVGYLLLTTSGGKGGWCGSHRKSRYRDLSGVREGGVGGNVALAA